MQFITRTMKWLCAVSIFLGVAACSDTTDEVGAQNRNSEQPSSTMVALHVYKSPDCGCCEEWVEHLEASGFDALIHHPADLNEMKQNNAIAPRYQSCHTAVSSQGYVFEGHIPAYLIQRFLADPMHNAIGLAVPGMPAGSPGMEMGNRYDDYNVMLLKKDGSAEVYQSMGVEN